MTDRDLDRFIDAQRNVYDGVLAELRAGRKTTHWMWFIFPQIAGLGRSALAQRYAITSIDEARAYLRHPILGPRLQDCAAALLDVQGRSAAEILGSIDAIKLRSSMTLFHRASVGAGVFARVIDRFFDGSPDPQTDALLRVDPDRTERIRTCGTPELSSDEIATIRALMDIAFGDDEDERFTEEDWDHSVGGRHFLLEVDARIVGHASVVERDIHVDGRAHRTGYVEAVAVHPEHQGGGLGSTLMEAVDRYIRDGFDLGVLGTGRHRFYERLGWRTWQGPSFVRTSDGDERTVEDDGYILVLETPTTPGTPLDVSGTISCAWRPGEVW